MSVRTAASGVFATSCVAAGILALAAIAVPQVAAQEGKALEQLCRNFAASAVKDGVTMKLKRCKDADAPVFKLTYEEHYEGCLGYGPNVRNQLIEDRRRMLRECAGKPAGGSTAGAGGLSGTWAAYRSKEGGGGALVATFDLQQKAGTTSLSGTFALKPGACMPEGSQCAFAGSQGKLLDGWVKDKNVRLFLVPAPGQKERHFIAFDSARTARNGQYGSGTRAFKPYWLNVIRVEGDAPKTQPGN